MLNSMNLSRMHKNKNRCKNNYSNRAKSIRILMIIINVFVSHCKVVTSEALGPGSVCG